MLSVLHIILTTTTETAAASDLSSVSQGACACWSFPSDQSALPYECETQATCTVLFTVVCKCSIEQVTSTTIQQETLDSNSTVLPGNACRVGLNAIPVVCSRPKLRYAKRLAKINFSVWINQIS